MVTLSAQPETIKLRTVLRHIEDVRNNCEVLGLRLIDRGEFDVGKSLIANGLIHDNSKFHGIEWEGLFYGYNDEIFHQALAEHHRNNPHHPEHWGSIHLMPRIFIGEMVCDWCARSSEFGNSIFEWMDGKGMNRYKYSKNDQVYHVMKDFLSLLLEEPFK